MGERVATTKGTEVVTCEVRIDGRREDIFEFLVDADKMCRWMGVDATLDARPGGELRVNVQGQHTARGEYVAVEPPHRVVFTWGWEGDGQPVGPGASTIEVTLSEDGDGTVVRLEHRDLPSDEARSAHADGWGHYMERLAVAAAGGDPGPDPWVDRSDG